MFTPFQYTRELITTNGAYEHGKVWPRRILIKLFGTWVLLIWLPIAILALCVGTWAAALGRVWET